MNMEKILIAIILSLFHSPFLTSQTLAGIVGSKEVREEAENEMKAMKKKALSKIRKRIGKRYLKVEQNTGDIIRTKCQKPEDTERFRSSSKIMIPCAGEIQDRRRKIKNTTLWPHCAIGYIKATFSNGKCYEGSGAVIAPGVVLTCAHLLYKKNVGEKQVKLFSTQQKTERMLLLEK